MKKLTDTAPIDKFLGQTVSLIDWNENETVLEFSGGDSISNYLDDGIFLRQFGEKIEESRSIFQSVIGSTVVDVQSTPNGILALTFSNGVTVRYVPDELPYESYILYVNGGTYPV